MDRLPLSVNKSNLLRIKDELSFASEGLELLDEKKEALMTHISSLSTKAERVRARMNEALRVAYGHLLEAIISDGGLACERASLAASMGEEIEVREKSFMGVALPTVRLSLPRFQPSFGFEETGAAMDSVAKAVHKSLGTVVELAEIDIGLFRLVAEIKKTIKRINALENVYVPLYEATIKYMEENLEEKEREFLFRLKRHKGRREEAEDGSF